MTFRTTLRVRFGDEDHARLVYFPRFFHYFHCAFEDFFDRQGHPYQRCLDEERVGWPAVHAEADYAKPVRFGQTLTIDVDVLRIGTKSATFRYRVYREGEEDADVACVGRVVVACTDLARFEGRSIPERYRALFATHLVEEGSP